VKWLLDTNVVSESVRKSPNNKVLKWIAAKPSMDLAISIVTLAELRVGALSAHEGARRAGIIEWIDTEIVDFFGDRTLPLTAEILIDWLNLSRKLRAKGKTREPADLLIAATARSHNLVLVSRNVRDFADTEVVVYDPWNETTHHMELA
jgi:predicted nucleic acid-binding protein